MLFELGCCASRAERWAFSAWKRYELIAPCNLIVLCDALELEIVREPMPEEIPGYYLDTGYGVKRIFLNINHAYPRRRFTLAHEIAHAAMDKIPCPKRTKAMFHIANGHHPDCHETFCDRFAADVLMPRPLVIAACADLHHPDRHDKTQVLASRFEVSLAAMRRRLKELGLDYQARNRYAERGRLMRAI